MKRWMVMALAMCVAATLAAQSGHPRPGEPGASGTTVVRAAVEVPQTVREFLAHETDPAAHERFWDDALIYTGSSGATKTKADIMKTMRAEAAKKKSGAAEKEPATTFDATDFVVKQFGNIAVMNMKLIVHEGAKTSYYRNTGTFIDRGGQWKAIAWQATKIADAASGSKSAATNAEEKK